jgi:hypothetical protein
MNDDDTKLQTFLQEGRVLLPGIQIFGSVLLTLPFQSRFRELSQLEQDVYLATFLGTILCLALLMAPATYHRLRDPVTDKRRFIAMGSRFVIAGVIVFCIVCGLSTQLVASVVTTNFGATVLGGAATTLLAATWFLPAALRLHERER